MKQAPLYPFPGQYARENGELEQYRASRRENIACAEAISTSLRKNFDGMRLSENAVKEVLQNYSPERVSYVLAATLRQSDWDERYSHSNQAWAKTVRMTEPQERRLDYLVQGHPVVLNGFVDLTRQELAERQRSRKKPSIREQLRQGAAPTQSEKSQEQER